MPNIPEWYNLLPLHLKTPEKKIADLERFRLGNLLPHETMFGAILSTPWAIIRTQEFTLQGIQASNPAFSERKHWTALLAARFEIKMHSPAPWDPSRKELMNRFKNIDEIMNGIHSWDELMEYIVGMDKQAFENSPLLVELDKRIRNT